MKSRVAVLSSLLGCVLAVGCSGTTPTQTSGGSTEGKVKSTIPKSNQPTQTPISPQVIKNPQGEDVGGLGGDNNPVPSPTPTPSATPTVMATEPPPPGDWFGRVLGLDGKPAAGVTVRGFLIGQDGGGLITNDGGGLITNDGGGIISNDGASAVAKAFKLQATSLETRTAADGTFTLAGPPGQALNIEAVLSDDVKALALPTLRHRVQLRPEAEMEGVTADEVINAVLTHVPVPR